jgi:hypothetical protein
LNTLRFIFSARESPLQTRLFTHIPWNPHSSLSAPQKMLRANWNHVGKGPEFCALAVTGKRKNVWPLLSLAEVDASAISDAAAMGA